MRAEVVAGVALIGWIALASVAAQPLTLKNDPVPNPAPAPAVPQKIQLVPADTLQVGGVVIRTTPGGSMLAADGKPIQRTFEVTLENARSSEAKAYVDLDTGQTFAYDVATQPESGKRRWVSEKGIDLLCETRFPTEGFVIYDMVIYPTRGDFDAEWDFATISNQLPAADAQSFNQISLATPGTKKFIFRTKDNAIGLMEIEQLTGDVSGLKLKYKLLEKPVPPQIARGGRRGGAVAIAQPVQVAVARGARGPVPLQQQVNIQAGNIEQQMRELNLVLGQLQQTYGAQHPTVVEVRNRLNLLSKLADQQQPESDPLIRSLTQNRSALVRRIAELEQANVQPNSTALVNLRQEVRVLDMRLADALTARAQTARPPTTRPTPTTAPRAGQLQVR